jgi:hypothetical protein
MEEGVVPRLDKIALTETKRTCTIVPFDATNKRFFTLFYEGTNVCSIRPPAPSLPGDVAACNATAEPATSLSAVSYEEWKVYHLILARFNLDIGFRTTNILFAPVCNACP